MNTNELVSVIIPVYNVRPYLREALDSVINQSYTNLEIIIIDDGSTDGSSELCDEYKKKDTRIYVIHQNNRGLSAARNVGLDNMRGDLVAFLDPDDAYNPEFIMTMLYAMYTQNATASEQADVVVCKYTVHYLSGAMKQKHRLKKRPISTPGVYDSITILQALTNGTINASVWNKLYRRVLWDKIRFPEGQVYEDTYTIYQIINRCNKIIAVDQPLYMHRIRKGSISESLSPQTINDKLFARAQVEAFTSSNTPIIFAPDYQRIAKMSTLKGMISCCAQLISENDEDKKDFREQLLKRTIELGSQLNIKNLSLYYKVEYIMMVHYPHFLRIFNRTCLLIKRILG